MGNYKGRDNVRKRASRLKKSVRLAAVKASGEQPAKQPSAGEVAAVAAK